METNTERVIKSVEHLQGAFGGDAFGRNAEAFARFFGTPKFLIGQTFLVVGWIIVNVMAVALRWDPYPFILLNLAFSLQAAYAAPLILLAQTRQADRDKAISETDTKHREDLAAGFLQRQQLVTEQTADLKELLELNTRLTKQIDRLTVEIHGIVVAPTTS
jgi:uncharacterized membrane protein